MPVNLSLPDFASLHPVRGVQLSVVQAGIKKANRSDLSVVLLDEGTSVAAVFTKNRFCAAPVIIGRQNLSQGHGIRALMINTGNANAGTGEEGMMRAQATCIALARLLEISPEQVLPFSTGVIMEPLPHEKIIQALPLALDQMGQSAWGDLATGIMTTDTQPKAYSKTITLSSHTVTLTGVAKGAGMIHPNMATMLGFIATDACVSPKIMQSLTERLANASFNRITVDGDTSTNDSFVVMATHKAGNSVIEDLDHGDGKLFFEAIKELSVLLAQAIVRDAEGATKFIKIRVEGGKSEPECLQVALSIAHSPLVKTAFFASDPNLGRILAAVGYAGIEDLDPGLIDLYLDDVHVAKNGGRHPEYVEARASEVMVKAEILVRVVLGRGPFAQEVWTCDLSHDYVSINADYRS